MVKLISEILKEIGAVESPEEKLQILAANQNCPGLSLVLRGSFHPHIHYTVETIPPYKNDPNSTNGMGWTSINLELPRIYLFEKGNPRTPVGLTEKRKTEILIQMLEAMEPSESKVFCELLEKRIGQVYGITTDMVNKVFPGVLNG